ncbi:hypothetical protein DIS18_04815 [Algibacter marinivivus]|uniref:Uncharacterized protein n=1 Tax=Algibacter marinivivus TaxID=2100723 RepID=A0A2U2X7W8_9FLAO|nr:hypothetical protein [Algibacter marinivivus]PWH83878.1 hypothetical protein DIS18_04815 [Algibacter marinivivus]
MKNAFILTKTNWDEAPRIRHQITYLLKENGYNVFFIEKNNYKSFLIKGRIEEGINFFSHAELIHHQLRYFPIIQRLNNFVVKKYLKKISKNLHIDFIVNFNYDYTFLRELFPNKKIITFINDDFEEQSKFGMRKQIRNQTQATCTNSDYVLTVSYPLFDKIKRYMDNVAILFPWSQKRYIFPENSISKRNTVLYFGFIGRLDWDTVELLVEKTNYNFRFIGPSIREKDSDKITLLQKRYSNFEYVSYVTWGNLDLSDVFCSILPYNSELKSVQACTISNRAFNLLSFGIPLVYADLKHIIQAPNSVIRTNKNFKEYEESLKFFFDNFYDIQIDIEKFLKNHYKENRWQILERIIND